MRLDNARLAELRRALILDSGPERAFDDLTRLLATTLDVPFTMVNMLDADRDWFKSCVGIAHRQSPADNSLCEVFFNSNSDLIVVEDTLLDVQYSKHPYVLGPPFLRFYAAARLTVRGQTVGTLCAYDARPRQLSPEHLAQLRAMSEAVVDLITQRSADSTVGPGEG